VTNCGFIGLIVTGLALCATALTAQDFDRYRQFELGSGVAAVSTVTGSAPSDLRIVHQRPALIQELIWRPKYALRQPAVPDMQSVEQIVFTFHEDRLFRVAIDYDQAQTRGLVDADMVEAVSAIYGPSLLPSAPRTPPTVAADTLVAQWGTGDDSVKLYRSASFGTRFRLILATEPVSGAASRDAARALVLDAREAPEREAARQKKAAEDRSAADEKARSTNRATFRP
jgi:hypothetical protein